MQSKQHDFHTYSEKTQETSKISDTSLFRIKEKFQQIYQEIDQYRIQKSAKNKRFFRYRRKYRYPFILKWFILLLIVLNILLFVYSCEQNLVMHGGG